MHVHHVAYRGRLLNAFEVSKQLVTLDMANMARITNGSIAAYALNLCEKFRNDPDMIDEILIELPGNYTPCEERGIAVDGQDLAEAIAL